MTRQEIRELARKRLGETTASFWTDTELNTWIDDAGIALATQTRSIKANGLMTSIEDQAEYTLSTYYPNLIAVDELWYYQNGETWRKLPATTRVELERLQQGFMSADSSVPQKYYWSKEEDLIGFNPAPNSDNAGEYVKIYYSRTYTDLTADTSTPTLPEFLHMAMVHHVVAFGYETRGYGDKANDAWSKYNQRISQYFITLRNGKYEDEDVVMKSIYNMR